jgi:hypothetical protein
MLVISSLTPDVTAGSGADCPYSRTPEARSGKVATLSTASTRTIVQATLIERRFRIRKVISSSDSDTPSYAAS